jgi:hypothetical protein
MRKSPRKSSLGLFPQPGSTLYPKILPTLKPSHYFTLNIQELRFLPTRCVYAFCMHLKTNGEFSSLHNIN